jgi:tRNA nucleotidyltransferase (CCA-adding enzyme)
LIYDLSLYHSIFSVIPPEAKFPIESTFSSQNYDIALAAPSIINALASSDAPHPLAPHPYLLSVFREDSATRARIYLASLLLPYLGMTYQDAKKKTHPLVTTVIRDSLKLGVQNHYLNGIPTLFSAVHLIKASMHEHSSTPLDRVKLGLLLRDKLVHNALTGSHWTTSLLFSMLTELVPYYDVPTDRFNGAFFISESQ